MNIEILSTLKNTLIAQIADRFTPEQSEKISSITITINDKMRTTAGRAHYKTNVIEMNPHLMDRHPENTENTFAHELAHLVSVILFGVQGKGHGRFWKHTMRLLGHSPTRTHSMNTSGLKRSHRTAALASCACRSKIEIKPTRARKMLNGTKYRCNACKTRLVLKNEDEVLLTELGFDLER